MKEFHLWTQLEPPFGNHRLQMVGKVGTPKGVVLSRGSFSEITSRGFMVSVVFVVPRNTGIYCFKRGLL